MLSKGPSKTASLGKPGLEPAQLVHSEEAAGQGPCSSCPLPTPTRVPAQATQSSHCPLAET